MNTIRHLSQYALQELKDSYPEYEIQSICHIIYMDVLHFTNIDIHLRKNEILDESFLNNFFEIIGLLKAGQPLQYIIGKTEFAGLSIQVNPSTLIPRPETAELVRWVEQIIAPHQKIADIGTGSGCIAIALAHHSPRASITGVDVSPEALRMAAMNATQNQVHINWICRDILRYQQYTWDNYDIIVSNPPYIRESEKAGMETRVTGYEPAQALFVPDDDPLIFYRTIAQFGLEYLTPQGEIFFEINEALGNATVQMLQQTGFSDVELRKDFYGKDRMIRAKRLKNERV